MPNREDKTVKTDKDEAIFFKVTRHSPKFPLFPFEDLRCYASIGVERDN